MDPISDKFCCRSFCSIIGCVILDKDGVFGFSLGSYNGGCIVGNGRVCRWPRRDRKGRTPRCSVQRRGFDQANEIVHAIHVIWDVKQERLEHIAESREVVVSGLSRNGLKGHCRCGEQSGNFFRCHGWDKAGEIRCRLRSRVTSHGVRSNEI